MAMSKLIETDPERAIQLAVPFEWRQLFPENITKHFESWVDARGEYQLALGEGFSGQEEKAYRWAILEDTRYPAFVFGRRINQPSQSNVPLHGIVLDNKIALTPDSIRLIGAAELQAKARESQSGSLTGDCCVCRSKGAIGGLIHGDIGGEVKAFCSSEHLELARQGLDAVTVKRNSQGADLTAGGSSAWTQGRKNLLYIRVNFPDDLTEPISETEAYDIMSAVNQFYVANSYNQTWIDTTVTPLLTLPQVKAWYATAGPGAVLDDARKIARQAGFDTDNYDRDIVSHTKVPDFDWGGLGFVGGKGTWLQNYGVKVTAHELGHNTGLWHANLWVPDTPNTTAFGTGTNLEYGNIFDTMGSGTGHFLAMFKHQLDWLPDSAVHTVVTNGVYRIYPFESDSRKTGWAYATRIRKDFERDYWLEFRDKGAVAPALHSGLLLNWSAWQQSNGAELLDAQPATATLQDAPIIIGKTYADAQAGVYITPLARGLTGTEPWIDVMVKVEVSPSNTPCCLKVSIAATNLPAHQTFRFQADVVDREADAIAYFWSFDDGTYSTNNRPWIQKNWSNPGEHVVRCEVSDMQGDVASANHMVISAAAAGNRVSGLVLDELGNPVSDVLVDSGITNASGAIISSTDSDGVFILPGVGASLDLKATRYGYDIEPDGWTAPYSFTSNTASLNFVARPQTNVSVSVTDAMLTENLAATSQVVLARSGSTSNELPVEVYLSGTALLVEDFLITPPLSAGSNLVTIPMGSDQLVFTIAPVNNNTIEPTEELYLSVRETADYVVTNRAEAKITILDDDQSGLPAISVTTLDGPVLENRMNRCGFVISRLGSTAANLPVTYTIGGTATAGSDYATLVGAAVIPAGSASVVVDLVVLDDKQVEPNETVTLTLTPAGTYTITDGFATATILDDDLLVVTVCPTGNGLAEPNGTGGFTIQRDGDITSGLVVNYALGGTAAGGLDYVVPSGTVTIPAGQTATTVNIPALDDSDLEGNESVILVLRTNAAYDIGTPGSATLWVRDDELPTVSATAQDPTAAEPGDDFGLIRISRTGPPSGALPVLLAISGNALAGYDYVPLDDIVVIPDGSASVDLTIIPFEDLFMEPTSEAVYVGVLPSTNYNIGSPDHAIVTIDDDDSNGSPAVGFATATFAAWESESPGLPVVLSYTSSVPVSVHYQVIGGTASGADYSLPPGVLLFEPGEWGKSIPMTIVDDALVEPDETVRVALYDPESAAHDGIKIITYTIRDDDLSSVSVTATGAEASEIGPVPGNFRIVRTGGTNSPITVHFQITGTASLPSDANDFGDSVTMPAGVSFVDLPVVPVNDGTVELDESLTLTLTSASGGSIVPPGAATIVILDANTTGLPTVLLTSTNQPTAVEGGGNAEFLVWRSGPTTNALQVHWSINGSATGGIDYAALADPIVIPVGQSFIAVPVAALDDSAVEGDEKVVASLIGNDAYRVAYPGTAEVLIQDNDQSVQIDATDFEAMEGGDPGEFTFTRFGTTNTPIAISYAVSGSASNGTDYQLLPGTLVIPAGQLSATLAINPVDDSLPEGREQVAITLQSGAGYVLGATTIATVFIADDEPTISITSDVNVVPEDGFSPAVITVHREGDPFRESLVALSVGGSATYGVDYPPFETNVFFGCGTIAVDLFLTPTNVPAPGDEVASVTVLPSVNYVRSAQSNVSITIADAPSNHRPVVQLTSPTANLVYLLQTNVNLILEANISDEDGDPLVVMWSKVSGPDTYVFGDIYQTNTTVSLTNSGIYLLRLTADDGLQTGYADLTVVVGAYARLEGLPGRAELLHWSYDEGSGVAVIDHSANGRDGAIHGAANWLPNGVRGGALQLSGTNNFVSAINDGGFLNGLSGFTFSCWIQPAAVPTTRGLFTADVDNPATFTMVTRAAASCGSATNDLEATLATTCGEVTLPSAANVVSNGWQHLALVWSNGLAPALYLNGNLDQPTRHKVPIRGELVNCPEFILGQGLMNSNATWSGAIDELRVFSWQMSAVEVGTFVATNFGPIVTVVSNLTVPVVTPLELSGEIADDGRPPVPGSVTVTWEQVEGPIPVTIPNPQLLTNVLEFTQSGDYVFRLIADDGQIKVYEDLPVTVIEPTQVYVFASDPDAAELGSDPGELTFLRVGDLSFDLAIQFAKSGTASNGADFVELPLSNSIVMPINVDSMVFTLTPFLDHRTEGDETFTLTVITNVLYTIASGEATIIIHDSPYGEWNIDHFTLEELTDPLLSGESADFDQDGILNFVEYASNRNPKSAETNAPLQTAIELSPGDGLNHITLEFQRWIAPTDVAYEMVVSTNLVDWLSGPGVVEEVSVTPDLNGLTETVQARVMAPWPSNVPQFVTVRVWLLATGP